MTEPSHRLPVSTSARLGPRFRPRRAARPVAVAGDSHAARAPWALTLALLPPLDTVDDPSPTLALGSLALLRDFITWLLISSMLRIRAQSVFNTPRAIRPAPVGERYARRLRRTPWLLMTEVVRNAMLGIAAYCSFLPTAYLRLGATTFFRDLSHNFLQIAAAVTLLMPTLFLGFRLGVATEAVVLTDRDLGSAFQRSFGMMQGRFERWFELVVASGVLILALAMIVSVVGDAGARAVRYRPGLAVLAAGDRGHADHPVRVDLLLSPAGRGRAADHRGGPDLCSRPGEALDAWGAPAGGNGAASRRAPIMETDTRARGLIRALWPCLARRVLTLLAPAWHLKASPTVEPPPDPPDGDFHTAHPGPHERPRAGSHRSPYGDIVGAGPKMQRILRLVSASRGRPTAPCC